MNKDNAALVDEVLVAERRWVQAHRDLDLATLESMLAEEYAQIRADGSVVGKAEVVASYHSGDRRWDVAEGDEYRVNVFGEVAILIGRWTGRGVNAGEPFDYQARFMAIYVKRDGRWLLAADQSTPLA